MARLGKLGAGGFTEADKEILVRIVKHAQWRGVCGTQGHWKKYLTGIDKYDTGRHDPSTRPWNVLASFVETWKDEKDLEIVRRVRDYLKYNQTLKVLDAAESTLDSPIQKLVKITRSHPSYARDYNLLSFFEGWVRTELGKWNDPNTPPKMIALDCEMVTCEDGSLQVVRVCVVDRNLQTVIDTLVKPNKKVVEYKSHITGVTAEDLEAVTVTQADIQKQVEGALSPETVVIGHSLHNDLKALRIDHRRVVDTSYIFPIRNRPRLWSPALRDLCKLVLGYDFRDDNGPHDCLEDARIPMKLALHCIEHGRPPLKMPSEVDEAVLSKLLIHKVPLNVKVEDLKSLFPKRIPVKFEDTEKSEKDDNISTPKTKYYSKLAVFSCKEAANTAFDQAKGFVGEDIAGRPQKSVLLRSQFHHKNAPRNEVLVRKMNVSEDYGDENAVTDAEMDLTAKPPTETNGVVHAPVEEVVALKRSRSEDVEVASEEADEEKDDNVEVAPEVNKRKRKKRKAQAALDKSEGALGLNLKKHDVLDTNAYRVLSLMDDTQQLNAATTHKSSKKRKKNKGKK